MLFVLVLVAFASSAQGRAVNISNTWVLPEEGFPVFYRYFRDRISWYEADAVCQFHHANLVTVDTTAQYDAVRAYLKELDITSAVWVGLIRSNPDGDFTWTDYRGLSGDGYWSSVPDSSSAPLCAASDPAADYRWEARACGGPMVASFICELPVPQWALGNEGCMVRALPALTILYLPESAAVQLTADCGMAGVKRIQCTGNVKRENLLKDLSCIEDDESLTISGLSSAGTSWTPVTAVDQDTTTAISTEESTATESEDTSTQAFNIKSTSLLYSSVNQEKIINKEKPVGRPNKIYIDKNVNLDIPINNNLQSNDIPKFIYNSNHLIDEQAELLEDEKNRQHKQFHEELARLGNFENIFTQPTDHFVPPLVMAKSKLSDDMTVLSFEEKHAQQLAEQKYIKHNLGIEHPLDIAVSNVNIAPQLNIISTTSTAKALTSSDIVPTKENVRKEQVKVVPKKYIEKLNSPKGKSTKTLDIKSIKSTASTYTTTDISNEILTSEHTTLGSVPEVSNSKQSMSIDLTITLKEPIIKNNSIIPSKINNNSDYNITDSNQIELSTTTEKRPAVTNFDIIASTPTSTTSNTQFIHDVVKITILNENHHNKSVTPTVFEITTLMPVFHEDNKSAENSVVIPEVTSTSSTTVQNDYVTESTIPTAFANELSTTIQSTTENNKVTTIFPSKSTTFNDSITNSTTELHTATKALYTTEYPTSTPMTNKPSENSSEIPHNTSIFTTEHPEPIIAIDVEIFNYTGIHEDEHEANITEPFEEEDFQSPLLSAANEPIHRPNRSRRPQSNRKLNKFNPFRMLG